MPKPNIHPTWYPDAKVICNGEVVAMIGSTKPELNVDVWSGNHPFFTGTQKIIDAEGRVDRFMRKYGMAETGQKLQRRGVRTKKTTEEGETETKPAAKNNKKRK